jgi:hypothetical protein
MAAMPIALGITGDVVTICPVSTTAETTTIENSDPTKGRTNARSQATLKIDGGIKTNLNEWGNRGNDGQTQRIPTK